MLRALHRPNDSGDLTFETTMQRGPPQGRSAAAPRPAPAHLPYHEQPVAATATQGQKPNHRPYDGHNSLDLASTQPQRDPGDPAARRSLWPLDIGNFANVTTTKLLTTARR